jgi:N-acetylglucosaminyl-diphospho-decaprenol L-rhamnosyltransferase
MQILFSVISHNQQNLVQNFVDSVDKYLSSNNHQVKIVVTENFLPCIDIVSQRFCVKTHLNLREKGFGSNHNSIFEKYSSDYIFIINPDIEFINDVNIDNIINEIQENKFDISSPQVVSPEGDFGQNKRENITIRNLFRRRILNRPTKNTDWLSGMFLIIKSDNFIKLKGFDPKFFMYVEDCDLGMRARKTGMKIGELSEFVVLHDGQKMTWKSMKHFKWHVTSILRYWIKNLFRFLNKNSD